MQSVGRLFIEPLWIFYRGPNIVRSLGEFKGKRIMIGGANSGTKRIASLLLKANGVTFTKDSEEYQRLQKPSRE